jgi:hypothetical protein
MLDASGQLGRGLARQIADRPGIEFQGRDRFDLTDAEVIGSVEWWQVGTVVDSGSYKHIDETETTEDGRALGLSTPRALHGWPRHGPSTGDARLRVECRRLRRHKEHLYIECDALPPSTCMGHPRPRVTWLTGGPQALSAAHLPGVQ